MVRKHMVDVGGQRQLVTTDYTGDAHDAVVELRANIRHLPGTCLYFRLTDEQPSVVLCTACAVYRNGGLEFHTRLHLGKHNSAVPLRLVSLFLFRFHT